MTAGPPAPDRDITAAFGPTPLPADATGEFTAGRAEPAAAAGERAGTVLAGRYTLLARVGVGGMGEVWAAEQTAPVRRTVAVKLIRAGLDSRTVADRFAAERQALALMDHPHIAKILDGGRTARGTPFFVMEWVDGVHLTTFCDARRLPVPARLELFVQVCQAVQHAHQKGIVHRDVKPSNVLVAAADGDRPAVKVIDFGLAKAVGPGAAGDGQTEVGAVVGTLEYMSPEQADLSNQDIDTRTDVYSLGVLLYELLVGTTPLGQSGRLDGTVFDRLHAVREFDPPRPSTRLATAGPTLAELAGKRQAVPARLRRQLRGDLDWIVMRCLEKDRTRRYDTAAGLAQDVARHLRGEPVEACPPTLGYRTRKYLRRNRVAVAAAGGVLLALVAGVVGTTRGMLEAHHQQRVAADAEFGRLTDERRQVLAAGLDETVESLVAVAAAFDARPALTRAEYAAFTRRILARHPEIQALEWVPRVPAADRPAVEAAARADGLAGFHFREVTAAGTRPAGDRPEFFPVLYFEPADRNRAAGGLDLWDSPPRRRAMRQAVETGGPVASAPIRLVQEKGEQPGFLLFLPVVRGPADTPADRDRHLAGFAVAVFRTGDLIDRILGDLTGGGVTVAVRDEDEAGAAVEVYPGRPPAAAARASVQPLPFAGRRWTLTMTAAPRSAP